MSCIALRYDLRQGYRSVAQTPRKKNIHVEIRLYDDFARSYRRLLARPDRIKPVTVSMVTITKSNYV